MCECLGSGIRCYRDSILVCRVEPGVCFPSSLANLELRTIPWRKCHGVETPLMGFRSCPLTYTMTCTIWTREVTVTLPICVTGDPSAGHSQSMVHTVTRFPYPSDLFSPKITANIVQVEPKSNLVAQAIQISALHNSL